MDPSPALDFDRYTTYVEPFIFGSDSKIVTDPDPALNIIFQDTNPDFLS